MLTWRASAALRLNSGWAYHSWMQLWYRTASSHKQFSQPRSLCCSNDRKPMRGSVLWLGFLSCFETVYEKHHLQTTLEIFSKRAQSREVWQMCNATATRWRIAVSLKFHGRPLDWKTPCWLCPQTGGSTQNVNFMHVFFSDAVLYGRRSVNVNWWSTNAHIFSVWTLTSYN